MRLLGLLLLSIMILAQAGCATSRSGDEPQALVLIVVDTLRGDRVGAAGYADAVTPTLDSLAVAGTFFTDAMTVVPVTLPSITCLLTGRLPMQHTVRDNGYCTLPPGEETLADRFREKGWRTGAVVGAAVLDADRGLARGFDVYDDTFTGPYPVYTPSMESLAGEFADNRRRADRVTDRALEIAEGFGEDPYFLFVHYYDVHMQYDPPPRFAAMHPGRPYDGEVSFVDHEIGRLLGELRRRGNPTVVVVSDHGESQNEHGEPQHGFLLYQSTLHVLCVASGPGIPAGIRRDDPVSLVDLEPTLARTFRLPRAKPERAGRTLTWDRPETEAVPLYAETFRTLITYRWSELRAIRLGDWKVIQGPTRELFDLADDPHELDPVEDDEAEEPLLVALDRITEGDDPERVYAEAHSKGDPGRMELLESLGYVGGGGPAPLPRPRPDPHEELPRWLDQQWAKELRRYGSWQLEQGDIAAARTTVDSVLTLDGNSADGWTLNALVCLAEGSPRRARTCLETALTHHPGHVPALKVQADMAEKAGHEGEAIRLWKEILEREPNDADALARLAGELLESGDETEALPYLRRLAMAEPDDPEVHYNLGVAAGKAGREDEAREHLERYLELDPRGPAADQVREALSW